MMPGGVSTHQPRSIEAAILPDLIAGNLHAKRCGCPLLFWQTQCQS